MESVLPATQHVNTPCLNPSERPVLDLPTLEGWKAELSLVTLTYRDGLPTHTDGHPSKY